MVLNLRKKVTELENREAIDELVLANAVRRQVVSTFQDFQRAQVRAAIEHEHEHEQSQDHEHVEETPERAEAPAAVAVAAAAEPTEPAVDHVVDLKHEADHDSAAAATAAVAEPETVITIVPPTKPVASSKRGPGRPKAAPSTNKDDN